MKEQNEVQGLKKSKIERLTNSGWKVGTAADFLGLSEEEAALIEMKLSLAANIKERRLSQSLTQRDLAKKLGSSQSRIAKIEAADSTVSMELQVRSLLVLGASRKEIGAMLGRHNAVPVV